jgi:hypothetical protein
MKVIFDCETELGRCDADRVNGHFGDDPGGWNGFAYTTAMVSPKGMLRVEQRCYFRSSVVLNDVRSQAWVAPEMTLEPVLGSDNETVQFVQELHDRYVRRAHRSFLEQSILILPASVEA